MLYLDECGEEEEDATRRAVQAEDLMNGNETCLESFSC